MIITVMHQTIQNSRQFRWISCGFSPLGSNPIFNLTQVWNLVLLMCWKFTTWMFIKWKSSRR